MLRIRTGSRLHFGLFSLGDSPRRFGGVGLMIEQPGVQLCAAPAREWSAEGSLSARVLEFARRFALGIALTNEGGAAYHPLTPQHFLVGRAAPEHAGLGTGTQLGLATARLLAEACGLRESPAELARRVGRGLRSALGVHGFERGGFLVEAGKRSPNELSPLVAHAAFPEDWRLVVAIPPHTAGLHGVREREAFDQLTAQPTTEPPLGILCRLTLLGMLPALQERDVQGFGETLYEFNRRVGELFAPVQGGVYRDSGVAEIVTFLRGAGVTGVGQSSWGPAVFAVVEDGERAEALAVQLREHFSHFLETSIFVSKALNHGASLQPEGVSVNPC
jgi:beta-ribofuranosylaminobenzene 5'-phosphate synthase